MLQGSIKYPEIKYIVLTIYADDDKIFKAIKDGASGYLLKEDRAVNIVEAISNVVEFDGIPMSLQLQEEQWIYWEMLP